MASYNVICSKLVDVSTIRTSIEATGATVNTVFLGLGVMNITSDNLDFASAVGVLSYEEDSVAEIVPSTEWHQLRVISRGLPMKSVFAPKNLGDGVTVYVVDSGIDASHAEFSHTTVVNLYSHNDDFTPGSHGTSVASLIGGDTLGVSRNVTLKNVVIPFGPSSMSVLLAAFDAIVKDHDSASPAIVNCSWTVPKSLILDTKIAELQADNLIVVAAAGNSGQAADDFSPVGLNSVLGVGASDAYDRVVSWQGGSSNWGPEVDLFAPGIDVVSAAIMGGVQEGSGTSLAAAVVSGVVAQFIVENPSENAVAIQSLVVSNASVDLLFRDETVYGTTPNLLVRAPGLGMLFTNLPSAGLDVAPGSTTNFEVQYNTNFISNINCEFTSRTGVQHVLPTWASISGNVLTFSPPADFQPARIAVNIQGLNSSNEVVTLGTLRLNVSSTPETLDAEVYKFVSENDDVVITPAACSANNYLCYTFGSELTCNSGKNSPCRCAYYSQCITDSFA